MNRASLIRGSSSQLSLDVKSRSEIQSVRRTQKRANDACTGERVEGKVFALRFEREMF